MIKGKEKKVTKPISKMPENMSEKARKKLLRPQDNQPIPTVAV